MADLNTMIEEATGLTDEMAKHAEDAEDALTQMLERIKTLGQTIDDQSSRNSKLLAALATKFDEEREELCTKSDTAKASVTNVTTKAGEAADSMSERLAEIMETLKQLDEQVNTIQQSLSAATAEKHGAVQGLAAKLDASRGKMTEHQEKISTQVQAHVEKHDAALGEAQSQQQQTNDMIEQLLGKLAQKAGESVASKQKTAETAETQTAEATAKTTQAAEKSKANILEKIGVSALEQLVGAVPGLGLGLQGFKSLLGGTKGKLFEGFQKFTDKVGGITKFAGEVGGLFGGIKGFLGKAF